MRPIVFRIPVCKKVKNQRPLLPSEIRNPNHVSAIFNKIWQRKILEVILRLWETNDTDEHDSKHLLTDCVEKYSDGSSDVRTERSEMQMKCKTSRLNLQGNAGRSK